MPTSYIWITHRFEGFHKWVDAPPKQKFLRDLHRHMFHVKVTFKVKHNDREKEFFAEKEKVISLINHKLKGVAKDVMSCEQWAEWILNKANAYSVEVSEDGENGAYVISEV